MGSKLAEKIGRGFIRHVRNKLEDLERQLDELKMDARQIYADEIVRLLDVDPWKARELVFKVADIISRYNWIKTEVEKLKAEMSSIEAEFEKETQPSK